jgi:integrase
VLATKRPATQNNAKRSFNLLTQLMKVKFLDTITTRTVDSFASRLLECPGKKRGSMMSVFTVNKHLHHLKAVIRKAHKWEYLKNLPEFDFHDEPEKRPVFMIPSQHFDQIYRACEQAQHPADRPYGPADWWRALMMLGIMTGMRNEEMMTLAWDNVSLDAGNLIVRHQVTKAKE